MPPLESKGDTMDWVKTELVEVKSNLLSMDKKLDWLDQLGSQSKKASNRFWLRFGEAFRGLLLSIKTDVGDTKARLKNLPASNDFDELNENIKALKATLKRNLLERQFKGS